jgi:hypothetical protein
MKEAAMWQVHALMALDIARERAAEAQAWRRAAELTAGRPSFVRRVAAVTLRAVQSAAAVVARSASSLADRVEQAEQRAI